MNDHTIWTHILGTKAINTYSGIDTPLSIAVANCLDNVTTDRDEIYTGVVVQSATIKGAEGEPVTCSLELMAATMDYDGALTTNTAISVNAPYTFSEAIFELPNATVINNVVKSFELTITNNWTFHYGPNREAQFATTGKRDYTLKLSTTYVDDDLLNKALGGTTIATDTPTQNASMEITLTRPNNDTLILLFGISPINTYNLVAQLGSPVEEEVNLIPASLTVTHS